MRWSLLPLAIAAMLCATACSRSGQQNAAPTGQLRVAININPAQLNPILAQNSMETFLGTLIFSQLVTKDDRHQDIPDLAAVVPTLANRGISRDGLTITYHLRQGVRWHDGAPFTAKDVIFTWHAIMNPANNVISRRGYDRVAAMTAPDDHTVVVRMKQLFSPAIDTIFGENDTPMKILPEHLLARYPNLNQVPFNAAPVGTGAYEFVRWQRSDRIVLRANPNYFRGAPRLKQLTLLVIPDDNTTLAQLTSHEVDLAMEIPAPVYRNVAGAPGVVRQLAEGPTYTAVLFNTQQPPLDDRLVRRALVLGMDRSAIVRDDTDGTGKLATADLSPYYWAYDRTLKPVPYDLTQAKALLDQAGWHPGADGVRVKNGKRLSLLFVYGNASQLVRNITAQVQQMYRPLGVEVELKGFDYATLYAAAQNGGILNSGHFDLAMYSWIPGGDPDNSSQWTCSAIPPGGNNVARYCSPQMESAQRAALSTLDQTQRTKAYASIERILLRDAPAAFLYYQPLRYARAQGLQNFSPNGITEGWNAQEWSH